MEAAQPDHPATPVPEPQSQSDPERDPEPGRGGEAGIERTLALAYRYLNRRERTVAEMRGHLEGRDCAGEQVNRVVALLAEQGYLDDARYAQLFTEDKRGLEQWGAERIRRSLLSRGIERELIDQALSAEPEAGEGPGRDGELHRAVGVLQGRFRGPPTDGRERERMLGVLLRKGYESELALEALDVFTDCADSPSVLRFR